MRERREAAPDVRVPQRHAAPRELAAGAAVDHERAAAAQLFEPGVIHRYTLDRDHTDRGGIMQPDEARGEQPGEDALSGAPEPWERWETQLVLVSLAIGALGLVALGWLVDRFILP
jgi:hypothetical protein